MTDLPLEIAFHNTDSSDFVDGLVRDHVTKMERLHDRIDRVRVTVSVPHKHGPRPELQVMVETHVPGSTLLANASGRPHDVHGNEDVRGIVHEAFGSMERQLKEHHRKVNGR